MERQCLGSDGPFGLDDGGERTSCRNSHPREVQFQRRTPRAILSWLCWRPASPKRPSARARLQGRWLLQAMLKPTGRSGAERCQRCTRPSMRWSQMAPSALVGKVRRWTYGPDHIASDEAKTAPDRSRASPGQWTETRRFTSIPRLLRASRFRHKLPISLCPGAGMTRRSRERNGPTRGGLMRWTDRR